MSAAPKLELSEVPESSATEFSATEFSATEYATKGVRKNMRANLRLVSPMRVQKASNGIFVMFVLGALALGMLGILVINTSLAQGAFQLGELRSQYGELARTEATLTEEVAALSAPEALENQARALGMVPSTSPAFIQIPDGTVLGKPRPAKGTSIPTPADLTVGEAAEMTIAGEQAEAPGAGYDPAAADAQANEQAQSAGSKKDGSKKATGVWSEPVVIEAEVVSEDALLDAVPIP
jgi:cell division protein FtsB